MKPKIILILAFVLVTPCYGEQTSVNPELDIVCKIQDAERHEEMRDYRRALAEYSDAYEQLEQIQKKDADFNKDPMADEMKECRSKLVELKPLAAVQPSTPVPMHYFDYITYPMLADDGWAPGDPFFTVGYGEKTQGLRLDIEGLPSDYFKTHHLTARLHRANGEVVDPTPEGKQMLNSPMSVQTGSPPPGVDPGCQVMTFFPWGPNTMGESWIEVSTGTERYWIEIPYGFDRNPHDLLPPPMPGGPPKIASTMKHLTTHDHVVHWLTVQYDLNEIHNGWSLSLTQSSSDDGQGEAVFYRWADTPRNTLRVVDLHGDGTGIIGVPTASHPRWDGDLQPRDVFLLGRTGDDVRCWGQIEITVDDKSYRVVVPSSLYKYNHGHAASDSMNREPAHPPLPRPPSPANDILIISATYGSGTDFADVTSRVADSLRQPDAELFAQPDSLGADPTPGWNKALVIVYVFKGQRHIFTTGEGGKVSRAVLLDDAMK